MPKIAEIIAGSSPSDGGLACSDEEAIAPLALPGATPAYYMIAGGF